MENTRQITTAIILAGGRGTRLGVLTDDTPKPLLDVSGKPFISYLIENLIAQGIRKIILSVGYKAEKFKEFLLENDFDGVSLECVEEQSPLGTGGAVSFSASELEEAFFVLNGDTIFDCNLHELAELVFSENAMAGLALRTVDNAGHYGKVELDGKYISAFKEKDSTEAGLINGGVYVLTKDVLKVLPAGVSSLENDLFPKLAMQKKLVATVNEVFFIDMGLPETYKASQELLPKWEKASFCPTVIFDRDGTLIVEKNYLHDPEQVEILPTVVEGLSLLQKAGYRILIATNQAGIGRGYYKLEDMQAVNERIEQILAKDNIKIDAIYYCPHAPNEDCECRKPNQGMIAQMRERFKISPKNSFVIGDKDCDVLLGQYGGMKGILVRTGYGCEAEKDENLMPDFVADNLLEVAKWILQNK